jgi:hypothetical protein
MLFRVSILLCVLAGVLPGFAATVSYVPSVEHFANPERGFYIQHTARYREGRADPTPLQAAALESHYGQDISLVLRFYVYETSRESPLSEAQLALLADDFAALRAAGLKAILRFGYTVDPADPDAPLSTVLQHLEQLGPVLEAGADVIATMQAGFIGTWGEWHSSSNGLETTENRRAVLEAVLDALPVRRAAGIRTPRYKQEIFSRDVALRAVEAFDGSDLSRTGHHNDCFLASDTDFGTYLQPETEKVYLGFETRYVPMGGETCNPFPPRSLCPSALAELAQMHWSYLNWTYHPDVLASWTDGDCMEDVRRRLGYRLRMVSAELPDEARPGDPMAVRLELANDGFAAPYNPRALELVLRHGGSGAVYDVTLPDDPRRWLPTSHEVHTVAASILLPRDLPAGSYEVLLSLPDPEPTLYAHPRFAIRLAHSNAWEAATGYNYLQHSVTVSPSAAAATNVPAPYLALAPADGAPTPVREVPPPELALPSVHSIIDTSAVAEVVLADDGGVDTTIALFWGETDAGTDPDAWEASTALGTVLPGAVSASLDGLQPETAYACRFRAVSVAGHAWSDAASFSTRPLDSDGDGMPDAWESAFFGGPTNAVAGADADGDGIDNRGEYIAGTHPLEPESVLAIAGIQSGSAASLAYPSVTGRLYAVEGTTTLSSPLSWNALATNLPGTGAPAQFIDADSPSARLYRIRVALP